MLQNDGAMSFFERVQLFVERSWRMIIGVMVGALAFGGSFFGYRYYRCSLQESAYRSFIEVREISSAPIKAEEEIEKTDKQALSFVSREAQVQAIVDKASACAARHSNSTLAPFFRAFQADALLEQKKYDDGLALLDQVIKALKDSPLVSLYEIKRALIMLDLKKDVKQVLEILNQISCDEKNLSQGDALYYSGLYYWSQGSLDQAKSFWQRFVVKFQQEDGYSEWVSLAEKKLSLLV